MASVETRKSFESMVIRPPSQRTYDLTAIIKLALSEDVGDQGLIPFLSSIFILYFFYVLLSFCYLSLWFLCGLTSTCLRSLWS